LQAKSDSDKLIADTRIGTFDEGRPMTPENFELLLEKHLARAPFHVFTIELHGGKRFEIDHPRATVIRDGIAVFIAPGGVPVWFDHESVSQIIDAPASSPT
jgi:hypothetical protein